MWPCTFRANLCNVISNGWKLALAWAGVYSQHSVKLPLYLEPRVHLAITYILKALSVAAACDAMKEDGIFNVCMETQRIYVNSEAELDAFGQASLSNWVCLCTLAELTHELLIYNRDICFNPEKWNSPRRSNT